MEAHVDLVTAAKIALGSMLSTARGQPLGRAALRHRLLLQRDPRRSASSASTSDSPLLEKLQRGVGAPPARRHRQAAADHAGRPDRGRRPDLEAAGGPGTQLGPGTRTDRRRTRWTTDHASGRRARAGLDGDAAVRRGDPRPSSRLATSGSVMTARAGGGLHPCPGQGLARRPSACASPACTAGSSPSATPSRSSPSRASPSSSSSPLVCDLLGPDEARQQARGQQHRPALRLGHGRGAQRGPHHEPDGQCGRARHARASCRATRPRRSSRASSPRCRCSPAGPCAMDEEVYESEAATNDRNRGIAHLLNGYGRMYCDPDVATDALHAAVLAARHRRATWPSWAPPWPTAASTR